MEHSASELDEADLALLYGNSSENNQEGKAWKGAAWEAPERIYETGPTGGPKNKAKSVVLTEEGRRAVEHDSKASSYHDRQLEAAPRASIETHADE
jgi:hypothetical protein